MKELQEKILYLKQEEQKLINCSDYNDLFSVMVNMYCNDVIQSDSLEAKKFSRIQGLKRVSEYMKGNLLCGKVMDERMFKDINYYFLEDTSVYGGVYRNEDVYISGTDYIPPKPHIAYDEIKYFFYLLDKKYTEENAIRLSSFSAMKIFDVHPFTDGNGRTGRAVMNYILMSKGFSPVIFKLNERDEYIQTICESRSNKTTEPFEKLLLKKQHEQVDTLIKKLN